MNEVISFKQAVEELIVDVMYEEECFKYVESAANGEMTNLELEDYAIPVVASFLSWISVLDNQRFIDLMKIISSEYKHVREIEMLKDEVIARRASFKIVK